jgi:integrase
LVHKVLQPIWITKTETATRVRQRIETVLDWCKARGYCKGDNPASLKGGLGQLLPKSQKIKKVEHHAALPYQRANEFLKALRAKSSLTSLALEFMLLTACRTGEVIGAKWEEIDLTSNVWTIPPERMKAGVQHRVPLSNRAVQILNLMKTQAQNEYVFPSHSVAKNTHMSSGSCLVAMKKMDSFKGYTPHGLRSTFRDWASETTNFANETTQLEFVCESLGAEAIITTKYHSEYAREGIEYSWGLQRQYIAVIRLEQRKAKRSLWTLS